jgi:hypothetical protein
LSIGNENGVIAFASLSGHAPSRPELVLGEEKMRVARLSLLLAAPIGLAACTNMEEDVAVAPAPPVGPGAIVGSIAADRNGDGIADGYYTADGAYVAFVGPPCPPPPMMQPPPAPATGERGI